MASFLTVYRYERYKENPRGNFLIFRKHDLGKNFIHFEINNPKYDKPYIYKKMDSLNENFIKKIIYSLNMWLTTKYNYYL